MQPAAGGGGGVGWGCAGCCLRLCPEVGEGWTRSAGVWGGGHTWGTLSHVWLGFCHQKQGKAGNSWIEIVFNLVQTVRYTKNWILGLSWVSEKKQEFTGSLGDFGSCPPGKGGSWAIRGLPIPWSLGLSSAARGRAGRKVQGSHVRAWPVGSSHAPVAGTLTRT